jgi:hypothetical protein
MKTIQKLENGTYHPSDLRLAQMPLNPDISRVFMGAGPRGIF